MNGYPSIDSLMVSNISNNTSSSNAQALPQVIPRDAHSMSAGASRPRAGSDSMVGGNVEGNDVGGRNVAADQDVEVMQSWSDVSFVVVYSSDGMEDDH